jgi:hypothetical protein
MKIRNIYLQLILFFTVLAFTPLITMADSVGQRSVFFVNPSFNDNQLSSVSATLQQDSSNIYFYFEDQWFNSQSAEEKQKIYLALTGLSQEFILNIYPKLTATFGNEWNPGIDSDRKITILFYPMKENAVGYVRNIDEYEKIVNPNSNQREMIYLNSDIISSPLLKEYLAHEFTHLIEFNQKERKIGESDDVWFSEAIAEYAVTFLGYNDPENDNSYLKKRISTFLNKPYDSVVRWDKELSDYGSVSMFIHYLVDQYGIDILTDSLKISEKTGIDSINDTLQRKGITEKFTDILNNWAIASYLNDCSFNGKYCYKNENLKNIHIIPFSNYIPFTGESTLSVSQTISNWSAHWQKFSGANRTTTLTFDGKNQKYFKIFYVIRSYSDKYEVKELKLDANGKGELVIPNMGIDKASVMIIPLMENPNLSDNNSSDFYYSITATTSSNTETNTETNTEPSNTDNNIKLPFSIEKPLNQMNREELLIVLLKVIIYLVSQGKLIF